MEVKRKTRKTDDTASTEDQTLDLLTNFAQRCKEEITVQDLNELINWNIVSLLLYVFGFFYDIYLLSQYYNTNDDWYFTFILGFEIITLAVMTYRSYCFYNKNGNTHTPREYLPPEEYNSWNWKLKWALTAPIPRYCDIIKYAYKAKQEKEKKTDDDIKNIYFPAMLWEDAELIQLNQYHSFMKSGAQLLLSLYLIEKDASHFGDYSLIRQIFSMICPIFSFISLSWALVTYDRKIGLMKGVKNDETTQVTMDYKINTAINCIKNVNWKNNALLFSAHFFWIVSRLMALSLFASVYGWIVWLACFVHLIPTFIWHRKKNYSFMKSLRLSFLHIFAYLYPIENESDKKKHPRFSPDLYQSICYGENVFLMTLWNQSFIKYDQGLKFGISSILSYPWNEWHFSGPWIVQLVAIIGSFSLFSWFKKVRLVPASLSQSNPLLEDQ